MDGGLLFLGWKGIGVGFSRAGLGGRGRGIAGIKKAIYEEYIVNMMEYL